MNDRLRAKRAAIRVGVGLVLAVCGAGSAAPAAASPAACLMPSPPIWDTVVTDVYWDWGDRSDQRLGKFVVNFKQAPDSFCHESVASATVRGPGGYRFSFEPHQRLDRHNLNGYVDDHFVHGVWLMAFDPRGFLRRGEYTITVRFTNGVVRQRSNFFDPRRALLRSYLEHRAAVQFSPSGGSVPALAPTVLRWTTLRELGGASAFYSLRVSEPLDNFIDPHHLRFWDAIFYQSYLFPEAGQDSGTMPLPPGTLEPGKDYAWFVELLDSNRLEDLNMAIFQPAQFFHAN